MYTATKDKIERCIKELELNLKGKCILTEAATGAYVVTPVIAAAAGAKVIAFTKNTKYGSIEDVKKQTQELAQLFSDDLDISIVDELTPEMLMQVDIITNSGHLRPIDKNILQHVKNEMVISYMYEDWEYRNGDLDLEFCKQNNIRIAATNERHPAIDVFNYLGELAVKLIHEASICLYRNKFIIISNNDFGYHIAKTLVKLCDKVGVIDIAQNKDKYPDETEWLSDFPTVIIPENYNSAEAIIFTAYPFEDTWIQQNGIVNTDNILKLENPRILRFAGHVDTEYLEKQNIFFYPKVVKPGHMGILLSEIGNDSVIRLQAGGLKVAEVALTGATAFKNTEILKYL